MTAKRHVVKRRIMFGDCDPAQIVYYPRFHMMFDRATEAMFIERGIDWKKLHDDVPDFAGMPILEVKANYRVRVAFGDDRARAIAVWREKLRATRAERYAKRSLDTAACSIRSSAKVRTSSLRSSCPIT